MASELLDYVFTIAAAGLLLVHARSEWYQRPAPAWAIASGWIVAIVAPIHVVATATDPATGAAAVFLLAFLLVLTYRLGGDPGPGAPPLARTDRRHANGGGDRE